MFKAIEKITGVTVKLRDYQIASVSTGEDAQGEVSIEVEHRTGVYRARALSTDIIEGSARAFLDVMNRIALKGPAEQAAARRAPRWGRRDGNDRREAGREDAVREGLGRARGPARDAETPAVLYIDLHLMHEVTSPQAFTLLRERGLKVRRPDRTLATMDHSTPTLPRAPDGRWAFFDAQAAAQVGQLEKNCEGLRHRAARARQRSRGSCTSSGRRWARRSPA